MRGISSSAYLSAELTIYSRAQRYARQVKTPTLHCPLTQTPLFGLSVHGVPSLTFPKENTSAFLVAQLSLHLSPLLPENSIQK